ncbi:hypothetical protein RclHR1_00770004 [Rhizophagus clarus]|uniref:Glutamine amidotransferase domain-containing protein n=1 Tax=Rhizophagus clarus TaxID=94130 RepID=A0A2Z6RZS7_9GLOM|nr:hypothetical protein RclHR1_00770004 [Rhizophagus clarus]GES96342.1 hypothetical protein RCL_jg1940.t1 [Rhizophagus clarus]
MSYSIKVKKKLLSKNDSCDTETLVSFAELKKQVCNILPELKDVISNIKITNNENEFLRLEIEKKEFQEKLQLEKLEKKLKELENQEKNSLNILKEYSIVDNRIYRFSDDNKEKNQNRVDNLGMVGSDSNKVKHGRSISTKTDGKTSKTIKNTHLAIVDISYREDKEGKSAFWDHYTFQRITHYPTRVVGTTNDAKLLKDVIYDKPYGLPISLTDFYSYKPTPPIIKLYPYPSNDFHGLLLIPGSHSNISECPNYEVRKRNEEKLIRDAWNRGRPVLGICDGALEIWKLFGGKKVKVHHHSWERMPNLTKNGRVGYNVKMHRLQIYSCSMLADAMYGKAINKESTFVPPPVTNSVHTTAMYSAPPPVTNNVHTTATCSSIPPNMKIVARSSQYENKPINRKPEDNVIEAVETCHGAPMFLIQWHPEAFNADDPDGKYHRNILIYMAKAGNAYYWKQKMLLELKNEFQLENKSSRLSSFNTAKSDPNLEQRINEYGNKSDMPSYKQKINNKTDNLKQKIDDKTDGLMQKITYKTDIPSLKQKINEYDNKSDILSLKSFKQKINDETDSLKQKINDKTDSLKQKINGKTDSFKQKINDKTDIPSLKQKINEYDNKSDILNLKQKINDKTDIPSLESKVDEYDNKSEVLSFNQKINNETDSHKQKIDEYDNKSSDILNLKQKINNKANSIKQRIDGYNNNSDILNLKQKLNNEGKKIQSTTKEQAEQPESQTSSQFSLNQAVDIISASEHVYSYDTSKMNEIAKKNDAGL